MVNNIDFILGYDPFPFLSLYNENLNFMLDSAWKKKLKIIQKIYYGLKH